MLALVFILYLYKKLQIIFKCDVLFIFVIPSYQIRKSAITVHLSSYYIAIERLFLSFLVLL